MMNDEFCKELTINFEPLRNSSFIIHLEIPRRACLLYFFEIIEPQHHLERAGRVGLDGAERVVVSEADAHAVVELPGEPAIDGVVRTAVFVLAALLVFGRKSSEGGAKTPPNPQTVME